jgi:hypothetical protein
MEEFVIEVQRGNRLFFITEYENRIQLTWMKTAAKKFSLEEAHNFIDNTRHFKSDYPTRMVLNINDAKNH